MRVKISDIATLNRAYLTQKEKFPTLQYIDTSSVTRGVFDMPQLLNPKTDSIPSRAQRAVKHNTILISTVRPNLCHYGIIKNPEPNMVVSSGFVTVDADDKKIDSDYLYYLLTSQRTTHYLSTVAASAVSSYPSFNPDDLGKMEVDIPSDIHKQKVIAKILRDIDDKISNNNAICADLEAMAKLLYDYWFVQFDFPDENGRPYKSSGGKMVWSEELKREIPEGWEAATFEDFIKIGNGKDHQLLGDGNIPVYGSGGLMRYANQSIYEGESVLIPRKGTLNNIMYVNEAFWTVDTMYFSVMKKPHSAIFMYYTAKLYDYERLNTGTGVPSMTASLLYSLKAIAPPATLLHRFDVVARTFYDEIQMIANESKELVSLRDFLLPMLMNGQVSFKEVC